MRYYIEDEDGFVVAKFSGRERDLRDGDKKIEVGTAKELSKIDVNWIKHYEQS